LVVAPLGSSNARLPSCPTENPEIVPAAAFAVYAKWPFFDVTSQHGAPWFVATGPVISAAPAVETAYDDAGPAAFETSRWPRLSKSHPSGCAPAVGDPTGAESRPSAPSASV